MEVPSSRDQLAPASYRVRSRLLNVKALWTTGALPHSLAARVGTEFFLTPSLQGAAILHLCCESRTG